MSVRVESPFPASAWPRVWLWMQDFRSRVADDFGPKTLQEFVTRNVFAEGRRTWGVWHADDLCGVVTFEPSSPVMGSSTALFRKDFWGRESLAGGSGGGLAETALRLAYAEIFAGTHTRIEATPFRDNNAILSLAAAVGAKREGVLRKRAMRGGKLVDVVVMGLLKEDFERCRG